MGKYERLVYQTDPDGFAAGLTPYISIRKAVADENGDVRIAGIWSDIESIVDYAELFTRAPELLGIAERLMLALTDLDKTNQYSDVLDAAHKHLAELGVFDQQSSDLEKAYASGHRDYWNGRQIEENLYDVNTQSKLFYRWQDGFIDARAIDNGDV